MKKLFSVLSLIGLLALFLSCSGSPPAIINTDWMLVYTNDLSRGGVYTELNLFVQLDDPDGIEDISEIAIHKDDLGWSWNLNPDNWVSYSAEGENWLGANGLTRGGSLPEGEYRLLILDRSGQRTEKIIKINVPLKDSQTLEFPSLELVEGKIRISTAAREAVVLWFYNDNGVLISENYTEAGLLSFNDLISPEEKQLARWVMIYVQDEIAGYGLKSGPFLLISEENF